MKLRLDLLDQTKFKIICVVSDQPEKKVEPDKKKKK